MATWAFFSNTSDFPVSHYLLKLRIFQPINFSLDCLLDQPTGAGGAGGGSNMGYCNVCLSAGSVNGQGFCEICGTVHETESSLIPELAGAGVDSGDNYDSSAAA
ncbi:MAG: hypothetical protein WC911_06605 [Thermoleophilia bacterium]